MSTGVQAFCVQTGVEFVMANRFMATLNSPHKRYHSNLQKNIVHVTHETQTPTSWEKRGSPQYAVMRTAHINALASGAGFSVHVQQLFPACSVVVLNV